VKKRDLPALHMPQEMIQLGEQNPHAGRPIESGALHNDPQQHAASSNKLLRLCGDEEEEKKKNKEEASDKFDHGRETDQNWDRV
jgi:hypothetical protein